MRIVVVFLELLQAYEYIEARDEKMPKTNGF
jgi:hypothetical protein